MNRIRFSVELPLARSGRGSPMIQFGSQRTWFSDYPIWLPADGAGFQNYAAVSHDLGLPPLVLHSGEGAGRVAAPAVLTSDASNEAPRGSAKPLSPANIDLVTYQPNTLELRYHADRDGWLLVSDRWAPHWVAEVNGRQTPVLVANFIFRAVAVTRGDNIIRFQYKPIGYLTLIFLSWGIIVIVAITDIVRMLLVRKHHSSSSRS